MAVPREVRKWIEAGRFEAVEDGWLERLAAESVELDYFVGVSRALVGAGQRERAATLLELLDEHLQEAACWTTRLELLRRAGELMRETSALHSAILTTLHRLYEGFPSLEGLMENVGLHRAVDDLPKTWRKVERLRQLLQYEVGSIVWMQGKGAGRVVEVNLDLESLKIDFEQHPGLRVGFAAAGKLLRALPPGHILRRKVEEPDRLRELKQADPGELLLAVLESYDTPRSAAEIRKALVGIVSEREWSGWWAAARKDPRVMTAGGSGRQTYSWARSGEDAEEAVRREFAAAEAAGKMELFRKNASRSATLKQEMAAALIDIGREASDDEPELALRVFFLLEREGVDLSGIAWAPEALLARAGHPAAILAKLKDRTQRQRLLEIVARSRDDWPKVYRESMSREEDPRLLTYLAEALLREAPQQVKAFLDEVLGQPPKRPAAFVWIAESAERLRLVAERNPLRLLQQILGALRHGEFSPFRSRLLKLYQSAGPLLDLLSRLDEEQAAQAEQVIDRAPVEEYLRTPLINALQLRFPSLRRQEETPLYATSSAIEKRRAQLEHLLQVEIPANRRAIEEARALGDLSENFEYKSARQRHEYLSARVASLERDLARVRTFEPLRGELSEVRLGCELELHRGGQAPRILTLLGPWESQPERGIISYESELGQRILGSGVGDTVEIDGHSYRLKLIRPCSSELVG